MRILPTKKHFCCCLILLHFSLTAYPQINVSGRVVDISNDTPIKGARIYFNRTTFGTFTNQQGDFNLEITGELNTELVISSTGYNLLVYQLDPDQVKGKRIIFKLMAKAPPGNDKAAHVDPGRKRNMEIFNEIFLGVTKEAKKCTISNERTIYFVPANNNNGFTAYADTPLVFINNMLGYKVSFNLVEFWYNDLTGENYILGYTHYEDLGSDKKWLKNRQHSYYGSTLHFYRSLIKNELYEQGFATYSVKQATDSIYAGTLSGEQAKAAAAIVTTSPITAQEILYIDSTNNFFIRSTGQLRVQYSQDPSSKGFLKRNIYVAGDLEKGVESSLLIKAAPIGINIAGVLSDPANVEYSGFWIYERAANLLPYDYRPD